VSCSDGSEIRGSSYYGEKYLRRRKPSLFFAVELRPIWEKMGHCLLKRAGYTVKGCPLKSSMIANLSRNNWF
jgi:hypothetical protein